jgi:hypothetical protein
MVENIESTKKEPRIEGKFNHGALIRTLRSEGAGMFRTAVCVAHARVASAVAKEMPQRYANSWGVIIGLWEEVEIAEIVLEDEGREIKMELSNLLCSSTSDQNSWFVGD